MFKQQFLLSVNENFGFSYQKYFKNLKFTDTKTTIFLIKKQTTPNLQFAGDVKFAGDNLIDPLKPKNITLKINETPHLLVKIVSITTFPQRDKRPS